MLTTVVETVSAALKTTKALLKILIYQSAYKEILENFTTIEENAEMI